MTTRIDLVDKKLICRDCNIEYIFTKEEQAFYLKKAFAEPKRCPDCRKTRKKIRRKNRRSLLKTLRAAEDVHVEVSVATEAQAVGQATAPSPAISHVKEDAAVGIVPAEKPAGRRKK